MVDGVVFVSANVDTDGVVGLFKGIDDVKTKGSRCTVHANLFTLLSVNDMKVNALAMIELE